jgi:hypothetical protein
VLAFPRSRLPELDEVLRKLFLSGNSDPVEEDGELTAFTYYGYCAASERVKGKKRDRYALGRVLENP